MTTKPDLSILCPNDKTPLDRRKVLGRQYFSCSQCGQLTFIPLDITTLPTQRSGARIVIG